jgi:hypothetical protein
MKFRLRDADKSLKLFLTLFLFVLTCGYVLGLIFVEHTTSLTSQGIQEQFLGNEIAEGAEEMRYAKSANEMFIFMHNHILSLSLVFLAVGGIFYFYSVVSEKMKMFLMLEPFAAILTTFGSMALVRYAMPELSWLVFVSGVSLCFSYSAMIVLTMKELWFSNRKSSTLR